MFFIFSIATFHVTFNCILFVFFKKWCVLVRLEDPLGCKYLGLAGVHFSK